MLSTIVSAALLGSQLAFAIPAPHRGEHYGHGWSSTTTSAASASQTPFKFPLANGFPDITIPSAQLTTIEKAAHGTLPNTPLASKLAPGDITSFQLIAFNELWEVAFFTSLLNNITSNVEGFGVGSPEVQSFAVKALTAVHAQEQLHALGANAIITAAGGEAIQPCEYYFPTDNFDSAISLARTFTDVVMGTLQDAQNGLAVNGDDEYVALIGAIIGQEGEQTGFYRSLIDLVPSELPFLTRSTGPWAFSTLNQNFIVPGSCPNAHIIGLPIFSPLTLETPNVQAQDQTLTFSFTNNGTDTSSISLVYQNQQNSPIVEKPTNIQTNGNTVTFEVNLPYEENIMNGLTIAVVTNSAGPFANADDVAAATLFGPALIELN